MGILGAVVLAPATVGGWTGPSTAEAAAPCRPVSVPMTLGGLSGPIAGTLCTPGRTRTLEVLVHGFTYGQYYWDFPYQRDT
jgi:hypothetical protein